MEVARQRPQPGDDRRRLVECHRRELLGHTDLDEAATASGLFGALPGVPTNDGITTVNPRSTTSFANLVTSGVMFGTSWITITPGPLPRR
jgi:hypothetical protein